MPVSIWRTCNQNIHHWWMSAKAKNKSKQIRRNVQLAEGCGVACAYTQFFCLNFSRYVRRGEMISCRKITTWTVNSIKCSISDVIPMVTTSTTAKTVEFIDNVPNQLVPFNFFSFCYQCKYFSMISAHSRAHIRTRYQVRSQHIMCGLWIMWFMMDNKGKKARIFFSPAILFVRILWNSRPLCIIFAINCEWQLAHLSILPISYRVLVIILFTFVSFIIRYTCLASDSDSCLSVCCVWVWLC